MPPTDVHHQWIKDISGGLFDPVAYSEKALAIGAAAMSSVNSGPPTPGAGLGGGQKNEAALVEGKPGGPASAKAASKEPEQDLSEKAIDAVLKDAKKRVEELRKRGILQLSDKYDSDTPRTQFFDDCGSGIKKAQDYADHMGKIAAYALKYGKGLEKIAEAGAQMKAIADKLSGGLKKVGGAVEKAKEISQFVDAVGDFASVSQTLDMDHIENVQHWADSMGNLMQKADPFVKWLTDKAKDAAVAEGSELGGAVAATLSIVAAQFAIGVKTLQLGLANEKAYIDKLKKRVHEIEVFSGQTPPDPPPPAALPAWESRDEEAHRVRAAEDAQLRRSMEDEASQKRAQKAHEEDVAEHDAAEKKAAEAKVVKKAHDEAEAEFMHKTFVAAYQAARPGFYRTLHKSASSENGTDTEIAWWDCLAFDDKENLRLSNEGSESALARNGPRKTHVSNSEASEEIAKFLAMSAQFQPVIDLYWKEHGKAFPENGPGH